MHRSPHPPSRRPAEQQNVRYHAHDAPTSGPMEGLFGSSGRSRASRLSRRSRVETARVRICPPSRPLEGFPEVKISTPSVAPWHQSRRQTLARCRLESRIMTQEEGCAVDCAPNGGAGVGQTHKELSITKSDNLSWHSWQRAIPDSALRYRQRTRSSSANTNYSQFQIFVGHEKDDGQCRHFRFWHWSPPVLWA
jgi:hypothetical protein